MPKKKPQPSNTLSPSGDYEGLLGEVMSLLETARRTSARAVNAVMTATYWEIGRRIVQFEQAGEGRASYGDQILVRLASDLTSRFGRGFSRANLEYMRRFFECWPIPQTLSGESSSAISQAASVGVQTPPEILRGISSSGITSLRATATCFPLPWSHYVRLLAVKDENVRRFYEAEALRGGWSVRQHLRNIAKAIGRDDLMG